MSRDTWVDEDGDHVDLVLCDYCPTTQVDGADGAGPVDDWLGRGWDLDPRPGRDRCPDCVAQLNQAATSAAGHHFDIAVGVP